eukprot:Gb_07520 [translate_table: standard]
MRASDDNMEGVTKADSVLIDSLLKDEDTLPIVLSWIQSHRSNATSAPLSKPWEEKLSATSVPSFAVSFLSYIRCHTYPFLQSATNESDQSSIPAAPSSPPINPDRQISEKKPEMSSFVSGLSYKSAGVKVNMSEARPNGRQRSVVSNKVARPNDTCQTLERKYEEEFPALAALPSKTAKKTGQSNARQARRVNPTPMAIPEVDSSFVLAKVQSSNASHSLANTNLSVHGPLKVDMDVLMNRFNRPKNQRNRDRQDSVEDVKESEVSHLTVPVASSECQAITGSTFIEVGMNGRSDSNMKDSLLQHVMCNDGAERSSQVTALNSSLPLKTFSGKLKRLATVHAKLIMTKMVPSLIGELYFLLQLLCLEDVFLEGHNKLTITQENLESLERLFTNYGGCSFYACKVLEQAGHILDCVGEHLLAALIEQPVISRHSPSLLPRLRGALVKHQAAALRSFKTYESACGTKCALLESPSKSVSERFPNNLPVGMPASLPFQAARDSRNNFKTLASQKIYNNRELCRDQFYAIIREAASSQGAFGFAAFSHDNHAYKKIHESVQSFLKVLMVENYPWFSELFVEQYLQASSYGETDPEVTGLARHDAAKLQRLHDRLTSESSSQPPVFLQKKGSCVPEICDNYRVFSPGSPWSKAKSSQYSRPFLSQISNQSRENVDSQESFSNGFSKAFPQSTRMYIWFLEAADSYRLNTQLICSIKSKICKLTKLPLYSRDAVDIGSGFTQRVLSLKSLVMVCQLLAAFRFLFFYPEAGSLPSVPQDAGHEFPEVQWDTPQCHPPIDLLEELDNARAHESLLLGLPWILDFIRLLKVIPNQLSQPYFRSVLSSLRTVYSLPMLDPSNSNFGVMFSLFQRGSLNRCCTLMFIVIQISSVCILAALDGFFEDMGMLEVDGSYLSKPVLERDMDNEVRLNKGDTKSFLRGDQKSVSCGGIDKVLGIVDTSYIQHCCPLLMGMRSIFVLAKKGRKMQPPCLQTQRTSSLRKITPIQNLRHSQSVHTSNMLGESTILKNRVDSDEDQLKLKLQHVFLEQRPHLQRLVDFIVDTTAVNAAYAASLKCVPQVLEDAMNKLEVAIIDRLSSQSELLSVEEFESRLSESNFEEATEHIVTAAIQWVIPAAVEYAKKHSSERTMKALSALAAPDESPYVLSVAGGIATEAAAIAGSKRTLANVSSEIRKQITRAVDDWRRKIQKHISKEPKVLERVPDGAASQTPSLPMVGVFTSRCKNCGAHLKCDEANASASAGILPVLNGCMDVMGKSCSPKQTETQELISGVKRQLCFTADMADMCCSLYTGVNQDENALIAQRIAGCCQEVCDCCSYDTLSNETRNLLRLHLASVCLLIESILSKLDEGLPVGGFDAIVFTPNQTFSGETFLDEPKSDFLRIEYGLIRRSVALAAYWSLLFPFTAFGFSSENLAESCYNSVQNIDQWEDLSPLLDFKMLQFGDTFSECQTRTCAPKKINLACNEPLNHGHYEPGGRVDAQGDAGCNSSFSGSEFSLLKEKNKACPMESLLIMWEALIKCGMWKLETLILEFLAPWRWQLVLHRSPWGKSPLWLGAAAHGISNTLVNMMEITTEKRSAWMLLFDSFGGVYRNVVCKAENVNEDTSQVRGEIASIEAKKFMQYIFMELGKNVRCKFARTRVNIMTGDKLGNVVCKIEH